MFVNLENDEGQSVPVNPALVGAIIPNGKHSSLIVGTQRIDVCGNPDTVRAKFDKGVKDNGKELAEVVRTVINEIASDLKTKFE